MHSMTQQPPSGVDAHADSHHVAALDERGVRLGSASFPTTARGHEATLQWLRAMVASTPSRCPAPLQSTSPSDGFCHVKRLWQEKRMG